MHRWHKNYVLCYALKTHPRVPARDYEPCNSEFVLDIVARQVLQLLKSISSSLWDVRNIKWGVEYFSGCLFLVIIRNLLFSDDFDVCSWDVVEGVYQKIG